MFWKRFCYQFYRKRYEHKMVSLEYKGGRKITGRITSASPSQFCIKVSRNTFQYAPYKSIARLEILP